MKNQLLIRRNAVYTHRTLYSVFSGRFVLGIMLAGVYEKDTRRGSLELLSMNQSLFLRV